MDEMIVDFGLPDNASPQEVYDECWKGVEGLFQITDAALPKYKRCQSSSVAEIETRDSRRQREMG